MYHAPTQNSPSIFIISAPKEKKPNALNDISGVVAVSETNS
jgi:hypothetical protein